MTTCLDRHANKAHRHHPGKWYRRSTGLGRQYYPFKKREVGQELMGLNTAIAISEWHAAAAGGADRRY